jgi:RND family efflux transporter MFP subunit
MSEARPRRTSIRVIAVPVGVIALVLAVYGIWSRQAQQQRLTGVAEDASLPRVQAISPVKGPDEQRLTLPGEAAAWNEAQIYGQVSGYVKHWFKDYGAKVETGEILATIDTPSLDAQYKASEAALHVAEAKLKLAEVTSKRFNALTGTAGVTQQEIDDKNAETAEQKAEVAAAQQNVDHYRAMLDFKKLRAPFAGVVTARRVNVGDFMTATGGRGTSAAGTQPAPFTVSDVHQLRVFVSVPQDFSYVLKPGLKASLRRLNRPGEAIPVQFLTMAGAVDRSTRTIVTEFLLENVREDLLPGAYVTIDLSFPSDPDILVVPSQAVLFRSQGSQIAVLEAQDRVHLQDVTLGQNLGLDIQILSGLKASDRIAANPPLGLLEGQAVKAVEPVPGSGPSSNKGKHTSTQQLAPNR